MALTAALAVVGAFAIFIAGRWLLRQAITLPALAMPTLASRYVAGIVGSWHHDEDGLLAADGADAQLAARRRQGLEDLSESLQSQYARAVAWGNRVRGGLSDLRFTDVTRVPFPFVQVVREKFNVCSVVTASRGPHLQNVDGNWTLDVGGSYGLNVAGFDNYKEWIEKGWERVRDLGPVLGPLHPVVADNIERLKAISGLDEVSFHMSGTEAVMSAVRLARFNTRRPLIVCFAGAYHGWWDGVQPGLGSERALDDCLTLKDLSPASLRVIRARASEIAAVMVNPVQSFHPNSPPPNDAVLMTSEIRRMEESSDPYRAWLRQLRQVCDEAGVPLIFDEVYTGFRLAPGGAQEFFGVRADVVVYGKTVAGGLPIGLVCGKSSLMRRFDPRHPMRMAYVVGTFSAHPAVMGAMNEFLQWVSRPDTVQRYQEMNAACEEWVASTNAELARRSLPLQVLNLATVWTVQFTERSRYNWILQYYLRAQGITLSWVGTGRCLCSMDFTKDDYRELEEKLVGAAVQMRQDGWWPTAAEFPERDKRMRAGLVREALGAVTPAPLRTFYAAVMQRKADDHHTSHNDAMNQCLHLVSSSIFIYCYAVLFSDLTTAMFLGLAALFVRQFGHAVLEPACHDEEKLLLGYNTRNKTLIVVGYSIIPLAIMARAGESTFASFLAQADAIAQVWWYWTLAVVFGRVLFLTFTHDFGIGMLWFVKLVTDPFTDIVAYFPRRRPQRA